MRTIQRVFSKEMFLLLGGSFLSISAALLYAAYGFSSLIFWMWLSGPLFAGSYFFLRRSRTGLYDARDLALAGSLMLLFIPVYCFSLYTMPWPVGTDEISTMFFEHRIASVIPNTDIFGLSDYFSYPNMMFFIHGRIGGMLGGVTLLHMRLISAFVGVCIIGVSYFFFRIFFERKLAYAGALLVGSQHVVLALSRMAMNSNVALLHELVAFTFLLRGFQKKSFFETFVGGTVMGSALYHYTPGYSIVLIWGLFLLMTILTRLREDLWFILQLGVVAALGFCMVACPLFIAKLSSKTATGYSRQQILLFPEARTLQQAWSGAPDILSGVIANIRNGLTVFNAKMQDHGYEYNNPYSGFSDPISGILVWVGLVGSFFFLKKNNDRLFAITGFVVLYASFAFFITKNPNYTRFLIVIPFMIFFVLEALRLSTYYIQRIFPGGENMIVLSVVLYIAILNIITYDAYIKSTRSEGDAVGGTARYIEARSDKKEYTFYMAASNNFPYYSWGSMGQWELWGGYFVGSQQSFMLLDPASIKAAQLKVPFTLFINGNAWKNIETSFRYQYPAIHTEYTMQSRDLRALEVR